MAKYYIGFDAGTQSVKVVIYNLDMECIAEASYPTKIDYPQPGWVQMDVNGYLEAVKLGMRDCVNIMKEKGADPKDIRSIFGDGIICGIVGIDGEGDAITPYINYMDTRTQEDVDAINAMGLDIWAKETGNAVANSMFPAMFARWFLKNNKDFQERGVKFIHNAPYVLMHLAGNKAADAAEDWGVISGWGLGYNIYKKEWSPEQLQILGIDQAYMPKIVKPWDIIGGLTKDLAEFTGVPEGTPICAGAGDTMQSMIGCGLTDIGKAADVAGTASMFCVSTDGIKPELSTPDSGLIFNSGTLPDTYFYWGYIWGGLALQWFRDKITKRVGDGAYYDVMSDEASKVAPGAGGVLFLPYLTGGDDDLSNAFGGFVNVTADTNQSTLWRAVLEAIGYEYMGVTDTYRAGGVDLSQITVTEGGSRSDLWNQIKADMLDSTVTTLQKSGGAVMTNVVIAAYAVGDITDLKGAFDTWLAVKKVYKPDPKNTAYYRKIYNMRTKLVHEEMQSSFDLLENIRNEKI